MKAANEATTARARTIRKAKRDRHLSKDGKWRSFPKVPNLLQYVIAGTYYARCKTDGKPVRQSLETDVFTVAKLRLPDKLEELRKPKTEVGAFADGRLIFGTFVGSAGSALLAAGLHLKDRASPVQFKAATIQEELF